uniref:Histone-lysine N-methyltransferase MLL3 n=1 Tax=Lygus hesperus TaxID=30085 RepID=A0A0A9XQY2_LYGHE
MLEMASSAMKEIREMAERGELPDLRDRPADTPEGLQGPIPSSITDKGEENMNQRGLNPAMTMSYNYETGKLDTNETGTERQQGNYLPRKGYRQMRMRRPTKSFQNLNPILRCQRMKPMISHSYL